MYLPTSSCSPSRNSIITGRYPHNTGAPELHSQPPMNMKTFIFELKESGYFTVSSGKFHMGDYARKSFDIIHVVPTDFKKFHLITTLSSMYFANAL